MNGASQNITLTVVFIHICKFENLIFIDIVIEPLKSHVLEIRVWMIVTFVFTPLRKQVSFIVLLRWLLLSDFTLCPVLPDFTL